MSGVSVAARAQKERLWEEKMGNEGC
jgi:hypothetical protein